MDTQTATPTIESLQSLASNLDKQGGIWSETNQREQEDVSQTPEPETVQEEVSTKEDSQKPESESKAVTGADKEVTKGEKDKKRFTSNWQKLQDEKAQFVKDREEYEKKISEFNKRVEATKQQTQTPAQPQSNANDPLAKYSDDQLKDAIENWEAEGDERNAKILKKELDKRKSDRYVTDRITQAETQKKQTFDQHWKFYSDEALKRNPELSDPDNELTKSANELLTSEAWQPILASHPAGAYAAVEVAKLRMKAASASALETKVSELNKEIERLNGLSNIKPGVAQDKVREKSFNSMSMEEQASNLRKNLEAMGDTPFA